MPDDTTVIEPATTTTPTALPPRPEVQAAAEESSAKRPDGPPVLTVKDLDFFYGSYKALRGVTMDIWSREITALIGPSGCGKSTLLRCFNRMNDLIPGTRVDGSISFKGEDLYHAKVDPIEV